MVIYSLPLARWVSSLRRYFRHELLPLLADLRLAIGLLLAIAVLSATGTVIEQEETAAFYQAHYPEHPALFGFLTWRVILSLGLDHVYRTPWFLAILILFGSSLAACSLTRQWPMLKGARRWSYLTRPQSFQRLPFRTYLPQQSLQGLPEQLRRQGYLVFQEGHHLYARKGLIGRIGPILVHVSMLLILLGAIWGSIGGFKAQELIPSGSVASIQHLTGAGDLARAHLPTWQIRANRFWIDYAPDGRVKQFYSDLSILDQGQEVKRQTISVNHPLSYRGVTLYQADWSIDSIRIRINNSPTFQIPVVPVRTEAGNKLWGAFVPTQPDMSQGLTLLLPDLQGTALLYDTEGQWMGSLRQGMSLALDEIAPQRFPNPLTLHLDEVIGATGLQIKSDPGIPAVYLGFGLLMVGVVMSYFSYSQIWALQTETGLYLGGKTNRALVTFEREFDRLVEQQKVAFSLSQIPVEAEIG
ncbi:cytochrome c biogenesis protein [Synechococcus sp. R55.2]|uniref:cytochrome c biogenesis protein n=1 Tax=Synechococcus sp. R55.2 TaxID=2964496 RepID=UPI0039C0DE8A